MFQPAKDTGLVFPLRYRLYPPWRLPGSCFNGSRFENQARIIRHHVTVFRSVAFTVEFTVEGLYGKLIRLVMVHSLVMEIDGGNSAMWLTEGIGGSDICGKKPLHGASFELTGRQ
jgi:hypothetical protein